MKEGKDTERTLKKETHAFYTDDYQELKEYAEWCKVHNNTKRKSDNSLSAHMRKALGMYLDSVKNNAANDQLYELTRKFELAYQFTYEQACLLIKHFGESTDKEMFQTSPHRYLYNKAMGVADPDMVERMQKLSEYQSYVLISMSRKCKDSDEQTIRSIFLTKD